MWVLDRLLRELIREGDLTIGYAGGQERRYGGEASPLAPVRLRFTDGSTPGRIARNLSMGAGEAYMDGRLVLEAGDVRDLISLIAANAALRAGGTASRVLNGLNSAATRLAEWNPLSRARRNVEHHYDLPDRLYELFLDPERQYSCAYFRDPSNSLEEAQTDKMALIAAKLRLEPGMRVLDIGCGWGGLARRLVRAHGVEVLGITLSPSQHAYAAGRAAAEGLARRVRFELADYRTLEGSFDRIVSVGMFEHVGRPHYRRFFERVRDLLTPDGIALLHTIGRADGPGATDGWTARYIFPGGYVPAASEVLPHIEKTGLWLADVEVWRLHYAMTLDHWYDRTVAAGPEIVALLGERFHRMWLYYLAGSMAAFRWGGHVVHHYQFARRRDAVPITRSYLAAVDAPGMRGRAEIAA